MYLTSVVFLAASGAVSPVLHGYLAETLDWGVLAPFSAKNIKTRGKKVVETGLSKMLMTHTAINSFWNWADW